MVNVNPSDDQVLVARHTGSMDLSAEKLASADAHLVALVRMLVLEEVPESKARAMVPKPGGLLLAVVAAEEDDRNLAEHSLIDMLSLAEEVGLMPVVGVEVIV